MLDWTVPEISDGDWIRECVRISGYAGSDASFANIFLLRKKYDIRISRYKGFVIRYYSGKKSRKGYTFPLGKGDVTKALAEIEKDAAYYGRNLEFCFITEEQKNVLQEVFGGRLLFESTPDDSDYMYLSQDLANLSGKAYHKKKNHVSKFMRTYPDYYYEEIGHENKWDAYGVEDAWYYDHLQEEDDSALIEYTSIKEALDNFEELSLEGGIIYVNKVAVAMTIASRINEDVRDVHFEKAIGEYAANGAFSAINRFYSQSAFESGAKWLNREEDIGIEGLRKAKESYHPKLMLKKYSARQI